MTVRELERCAVHAWSGRSTKPLKERAKLSEGLFDDGGKTFRDEGPVDSGGIRGRG
jgi:hypothetical protein